MLVLFRHKNTEHNSWDTECCSTKRPAPYADPYPEANSHSGKLYESCNAGCPISCGQCKSPYTCQQPKNAYSGNCGILSGCCLPK